MVEKRIQRPIRMGAKTPQRLKRMAKAAGFLYHGDGSIGAFLDALVRLSDESKAIVVRMVSGACKSEPLPLQPISEAPVGEPVLGVWRHSDRVDFLSCYLHRSGKWYLTHDTTMTRPMRAPDGWLPLPVIDGGGVEKLIEEKE